MQVVAFDQSQQMVDLARARGVNARIGTVEAIPSDDGAFEAAVANFMLYHIADVDRALGELARVAPALVAATMGYDQLRRRYWGPCRPRSRTPPRTLRMRETGQQLLHAHYTNVRMVDLPGHRRDERQRHAELHRQLGRSSPSRLTRAGLRRDTNHHRLNRSLHHLSPS